MLLSPLLLSSLFFKPCPLLPFSFSSPSIVVYSHIYASNMHCRPYFIRFSRTSAGAGLAALQAHRIAIDDTVYDTDGIAEQTQFLATLIALYGVGTLAPEDVDVLIPKLRRWVTAFRGRLASDASDRCLKAIQGDQ